MFTWIWQETAVHAAIAGGVADFFGRQPFARVTGQPLIFLLFPLLGNIVSVDVLKSVQAVSGIQAAGL
jgi:hypothetical protein